MQVNIDPESGNYPAIRKGGKYGPDCPNTAECRVVNFRALVEADNAPPFDRELDRGPYCQFTFQIVEGDQTVFHDEWQTLTKGTGSKALRWIKALGVQVDDAGNFDDENITNKPCILEFKEPAYGKNDHDHTGRKYTKVLSVFGLEA